MTVYYSLHTPCDMRLTQRDATFLGDRVGRGIASGSGMSLEVPGSYTPKVPLDWWGP